MTEPVEDGEQAEHEAKPRNLAAAYVELNDQLKRPGLGAAQLKSIGDGFRSMLPSIDVKPVDFLAEPRRRLQEQMARDRAAVEGIMDAFEPDTRPDEIAANTARSAELISQQNTAIAQLVELTLSNLALSEAQQKQSERTEKFTKTMTWISVALAFASLIAAVVAIAVSS
jgi:hypothetical protein